METLSCWGFKIPTDTLDSSEVSYIEQLPKEFPSLQWLWHEMDRVWDQYGLENKRPLALQPIEEFYSHPIWLVNGIFSSLDSVSRKHRLAIAQFVAQMGATEIVDYGGGFGELAIMIRQANPSAQISIVEPYPAPLAMKRIRDIPDVSIVPALGVGYDAAIAQDVLEHVEDPVGLALDIANGVKDGGVLVLANCFRPVIKCHLPATFYLRHTFRFVMKAAGLRFIGAIAGARHALCFERSGIVSRVAARRAAGLSRLIGPVVNVLHATGGTMSRGVFKR